eukprot:ctg_7626.g641
MCPGRGVAVACDGFWRRCGRFFGKSGRMGAASSEAAAVAGEATETPKRPRKPDAPRRSTSGEDTVGGAEVLPPAAVAERLAAVPVTT